MWYNGVCIQKCIFYVRNLTGKQVLSEDELR